MTISAVLAFASNCVKPVRITVRIAASFFCGASAQLRTLPPRFDISRSQTMRHAYPVEVFRKNDLLVAEAATYTTHNKHKRRTAMLSDGFRPVIREIQQPHTSAADRTATAGYPISGLKFESGISRIQGRSANHMTAIFGVCFNMRKRKLRFGNWRCFLP